MVSGRDRELSRPASSRTRAAGFNHAFIDCAAVLRATVFRTAYMLRNRTRLKRSNVSFCGARGAGSVREPVATGATPQNDYDAELGPMRWRRCCGARATSDLDDFTDAAIRDPQVLALAQRVRVSRPGARGLSRAASRAASASACATAARVEHHEPINRGSAERPLGEDEVRNKFRRNAVRVLPEEQVEAVIAAVAAVEQAADLLALTTALRLK